MNIHGKNICKQLKEIRKGIADENGIPLEVEECTFKGECLGTCPRCEEEVRYLENALSERLRLGKVATVAGIALGLASATTVKAQTPVAPVVPNDSLAKVECHPFLQIDSVDFYKLQEESTGTIRGEGGSTAIVPGLVRRRTDLPISETPPLNKIQADFIEDNGTPASQPASTEPPKMYEEEE